MEITEIKQRLTLKEVLEHYGLKPDKQNRLNCLFHPDKTPSMQVYYKTQTAYCFSSNCPTHGKSLDLIDFSDPKGMDFVFGVLQNLGMKELTLI